MLSRILATALILSLTLALAACADEAPPEDGVDTPVVESPDDDLRLAPGLYDMEDGTVQAIGTLERVELEGGFWAIVDGTVADAEEGRTIVVIANGDELADELEPLEGRQVSATGERFDGASIRMAGPEMVADSVVDIEGGPGGAE